MKRVNANGLSNLHATRNRNGRGPQGAFWMRQVMTRFQSILFPNAKKRAVDGQKCDARKNGEKGFPGEKADFPACRAQQGRTAPRRRGSLRKAPS